MRRSRSCAQCARPQPPTTELPRRLPRPALVLALLAAGCAGEGGLGSTPPPDQPASYATIQSEIFDQRCISTTCHAAGTRAGNLSLVSADSYDELVNVDPQNAAAAAAGLLRVAPEDPENSFLLRKLTGELGSGEGARMPLGSAPLNEDEIEMVRTWIEAGALQDE